MNLVLWGQRYNFFVKCAYFLFYYHFIFFLELKEIEYSGNFVPLQPIRVFQNGQLFEIKKQKSFPKRTTLTF